MYSSVELQKRVVYFTKFLLLNAYDTVRRVNICRLHKAKALVAGNIQRWSDEWASFRCRWIIVCNLSQWYRPWLGPNKRTPWGVHWRGIVTRILIRAWGWKPVHLRSSIESSFPVKLGRPRSICLILSSVFFFCNRLRYFQNDTKKDSRSFYEEIDP